MKVVTEFVAKKLVKCKGMCCLISGTLIDGKTVLCMYAKKLFVCLCSVTKFWCLHGVNQ